jgi:hypothetical protein
MLEAPRKQADIAVLASNAVFRTAIWLSSAESPGFQQPGMTISAQKYPQHQYQRQRKVSAQKQSP